MQILKLLSFAAALGTPGVCLAADPTVADGSGGLTLVDWSIVAVYAAATIGLGWYYSRRQASTDEYFVGSGNMNPLLVGVSLFATLLSTISYLSMPGETLGRGPVGMTTMLALPLIYYIVGYGLLPVYMQQKVTSAYELLEQRLGLSVRLLGASLFVILRLIWMSLLVYLTSTAIVTMLGLSDNAAAVPVVALLTGFVAVIYTSLGGLRAVIITDFMQTILLFGGALLVLILVTLDLGGLTWIPTAWNDSWDTQPLLPTNLSTRVSVLGSFASYLLWYVCTSGGDQTSVQRFMATSDLRAARRAYATQLFVSAIVGITLGLVGFALLGYFQSHPAAMPAGASLKADADTLFPHYIAFHLPVGISGLVVAAMFAAAMSSIDSGVNSITAVVMTDGFKRLAKDHSDTQGSETNLNHARWMAFAIGAIAVVGSSAMGLIPGNITEVTGKTSNLLTTPIFGLFLFALFIPFASPVGAWTGTVCGIITAVLIAFSGPIFGTVPGDSSGTELDPISFQWIAPIALAVILVTGCLASWMFPRSTIPATGVPASE